MEYRQEPRAGFAVVHRAYQQSTCRLNAVMLAFDICSRRDIRHYVVSQLPKLFCATGLMFQGARETKKGPSLCQKIWSGRR